MKLNPFKRAWLVIFCFVFVWGAAISYAQHSDRAGSDLNAHHSDRAGSTINALDSNRVASTVNALHSDGASSISAGLGMLNTMFNFDMRDTTSSGTSDTELAPHAPAPHQPLSEHIASYHIDVTLDVANHQLIGKQIVTWRHPGEEAIHELYMHLYPNAFYSKDSTFIQESDGTLRDDKMREDSYGHITIHSIRNDQGEELTPYMSYVQPDDGNAADRSLMRLGLPTKLFPGEEITLHLQFEVTLPYVFARMGYTDDGFVMAGQWFPKLAVYERKGMRQRQTEGWNIHQYHGNSEFYANFGLYNVRIHVPRDYTVAATGMLTKKPELNKNTKTYHFYAEDVHDFAWAASPHFIYVETPFATPDIPGVRIKLYLDPAHAHLKHRYLHAAQRSLARFSEWYGEYPYSSLSIVVPPPGGSGAGGMEYPTLVTAWAADDTEPGFELERVIVHEIAHQYFYGMVASNEFEEAWLDEAFTSYAEDKLMQAEYGIVPPLPIEASYITSPASLQKAAWEYDDHGHYADNVYIRGKLVLWDIERQIGTAEMERALKYYVHRWKFRHPSTQDFQWLLEEVTGRSWQGYFDDYIYGSEMVDYAVGHIHIRPLDKQYESSVHIHNYGPAHHAATILFHFADGKEVYKTWDGTESSIQFKLLHTAPIDWVMIDPDYALVLENKHMNNFLKTTVPRKSQLRWQLGSVKLVEMLIDWVTW